MAYENIVADVRRYPVNARSHLFFRSLNACTKIQSDLSMVVGPFSRDLDARKLSRMTVVELPPDP